MARVFADKQLYRSDDALLGGVCGCFARRFDLDPILVRILALVIASATLGLGIIAYCIMWAMLPRQSQANCLYEIEPEHAESMAHGAMDPKCSDGAFPESGASALPFMVRLATAVCLMLLFLGVALIVSPMVVGTQWWQFWPLACIIGGLCLIVIPIRGRWEVAWHAAGIILTSFAALLLPMSLGVMSPGTFGYAFGRMWFIVLAGAAFVIVGVVHDNGALIVVGALLLAFFFVMSLLFCGVPGDVDQLMLNVPGGNSLRIAMAPASP